MDDALLKKVQRLECEILKEIDRICTKNGLTYFLAYGTLLGAVRHQGFIPWDDDLDVFMLREDYDKFLEICSQELGEEFVLHYHGTDKNYPLSMTKIRLKNTVFREKVMNLNLEYEGIWVDVFVLDDVKEETSFVQRFQFKAVGALNTIIGVRLGQNRLTACSTFTKITYVVLRLLSVNALFKLQNRARKCLSGKGREYVVEFSGCYGQYRQTLKKEDLFPAQRIAFGDAEFCAPCNPNNILRHIYGDDYMTPPPIEKRKTHNPVKIDLGPYSE